MPTTQARARADENSDSDSDADADSDAAVAHAIPRALSVGAKKLKSPSACGGCGGGVGNGCGSRLKEECERAAAVASLLK